MFAYTLFYMDTIQLVWMGENSSQTTWFSQGLWIFPPCFRGIYILLTMSCVIIIPNNFKGNGMGMGAG